MLLAGDLIQATARALAGHDASARSLDRLVELMPQILPGCRAATAARWRDGTAVEMAASDGSVADLLARELERGSGPTVEALRAGHVWCADTGREERWTGFRADALRAGIRSCVALAQPDGAAVVTMCLYGVRRGSLRPSAAAVAWLFTVGRRDAGSGGPRDASGSPGEPSAGARPADELAWREAKQLLMRALGADDREAGNLLRQMSEECRADGEDVARWLVVEHMRAVARIGEAARASGRQRPGVAAAVTARQRSGARTAAWTGKREIPRTRPDAARVQSPAGKTYSDRLARLAQYAAVMRQQLASSATSIAQTEARLADTLDKSAEFRIEHAERLWAKASEARRYSREVRRLARNLSRDQALGRARAPADRAPADRATADRATADRATEARG